MSPTDHLRQLAAKVEVALSSARETREESAALRCCLTAAGLICQERFSAALHRLRFAAQLRASPLWDDDCTGSCSSGRGSASTLSTVLQLGGELGAMTASFASVGAARILSATSRSMHAVVQEAAGPALTKQLYLMGSDGQALAGANVSTACFDPMLGRWMGVSPSQTRHDAATWCEMGGRLYACGGLSPDPGEPLDFTSAAECYDPKLASWEALPCMSTARLGAACCTFSGCLYVCGGATSPRLHNDEYEATPLRSAERFNPLLGHWETLPPMHAERDTLAACSVESECLFVYGHDVSRPEPASVDRLLLSPERWQALPPFQQDRVQPMGCALAGGLFVCGGAFGRRSAEWWDPESRNWLRMPSMSEARVGGLCCNMAGSIYVCGGRASMRYSEPHLRSMERYLPELARWETLQHLPAMHLLSVHAACHLHGCIYVLSHGTVAESESTQVQRFDPSLNCWEVLPLVPQGFHSTARCMVAVATAPAESRLHAQAYVTE